eukprot:m.302639 g.302639  ORF g.302639 m.302639 type:complete len:54 (+) comp40821_c0_seq8:97-258(+)
MDYCPSCDDTSTVYTVFKPSYQMSPISLFIWTLTSQFRLTCNTLFSTTLLTTV